MTCVTLFLLVQERLKSACNLWKQAHDPEGQVDGDATVIT